MHSEETLSYCCTPSQLYGKVRGEISKIENRDGIGFVLSTRWRRDNLPLVSHCDFNLISSSCKHLLSNPSIWEGQSAHLQQQMSSCNTRMLYAPGPFITSHTPGFRWLTLTLIKTSLDCKNATKSHLQWHILLFKVVFYWAKIILIGDVVA